MRFAFFSSLVASLLLASFASAVPISLNLSKPDGSNYNLSTNPYDGAGEQLSMGATVNVEGRRVEGGSLSMWTENDNPNAFQGIMNLYGWEGMGPMSPSPYHSLSMYVDGIHLSIANEVRSMEMINNHPMMYYTSWANVAVDGPASFTYAYLNQNVTPQDDGNVWFSDNFWFHGTREGENLQGFSIFQNLAVPEPVTLGLVGLAIPFVLRRR